MDSSSVRLGFSLTKSDVSLLTYSCELFRLNNSRSSAAELAAAGVPVFTVSQSEQMMPSPGVVRVVKTPIVPSCGNPGITRGKEIGGSITPKGADQRRKVTDWTDIQTFQVAGNGVPTSKPISRPVRPSERVRSREQDGGTTVTGIVSSTPPKSLSTNCRSKDRSVPSPVNWI